MINNKESLEKHPIYSFDTDMGSSILFNDECSQKSKPDPSDSGSNELDQQNAETKQKYGPDDVSPAEETSEGWWHMSFDGVVSKEGARAGVWIRPPSGKPQLLSYKLYFDCTNNVVEYEALVLGLRSLRDLKAKKIDIYGDSQLVVKQVQGCYQAKHPRLRSYKNLVLHLLEVFKEHHFTVIPRKENIAVDALAISTSVFQLPIYPSKKYKIEVRHRPAILDNVDHWEVFEDDKHIIIFMDMYGEFNNIKLYQENMFEEGESVEPDPEYLT